MGVFTNKIDFEVVIMVNHGNPNGDPLNGNRPREDFDGFGEISDVCLKRKIRNRLQDLGEKLQQPVCALREPTYHSGWKHRKQQ